MGIQPYPNLKNPTLLARICNEKAHLRDYRTDPHLPQLRGVLLQEFR